MEASSTRRHLSKYHDQIGRGGVKRPFEDDTDSDFSDDSDGDFGQNENHVSDMSADSHYSDNTDFSDDADESEMDPWETLVDEVVNLHRAEMKKRAREIEDKENISKESAHKKMRKELLPQLNETFREKYVNLLKHVRSMTNDSTHRKIVDTAKRFRNEDEMDWEESIEEAVNRRKFLLARELNKWTLDVDTDTESDTETDTDTDTDTETETETDADTDDEGENHENEDEPDNDKAGTLFRLHYK